MWHGCWYRTGWSDYSADLLGLSTQSFTEEALKRQHAALTADLWEKRPHWCQRSEETSLNPQHIKLEADVYCSRRPHHALLSAKNRTDCLIQWHPLFWKESDRVSHARPASSSSLPQSEGMLVRLTCDSEGMKCEYECEWLCVSLGQTGNLSSVNNRLCIPWNPTNTLVSKTHSSSDAQKRQQWVSLHRHSCWL